MTDGAAPRKVLLDVRGDLKTHFYTYDGIARAVDGVNFDIAEGETFGLVGETGCGKSMTALSIMRLVDPPGRIVSGQVLFEGDDLLRKTERDMEHIRGNRIGMIFQDPTSSLNPLLTVGFQIAESITLHRGAKGREAEGIAAAMLEQVRIPDPVRTMKRYPHELSGGMQQRIMIAIALCCRPSLIIADEPTTALDVTIQAQIIQLLNELKARSRSSMLMITHNLGLVARSCDRVGVMYAGNLVEICAVETVFSQPLHPYTRGLISAVPRAREARASLPVIPGRIPDIIRPPTGCKFHPRCDAAVPACRQASPALVEVAPGHRVACLLAGGEG